MYREQLGISDDAPVIGMVGRINDKGQDRILELMPDLLKTLPNLKVVMVGPSKNARETVESFRKRVAALDLCESVIVTGPAHENASEIMNAFDCMVHLPDYEAFGLVLPEAGAEGLPVIASNVGGIPEVVKDKVTGIIVDRDDTNAIISAILTLFDPIDGEEKRRRMGESGRARAIDLFSLQASIDQILEDYKLLNKREK
jgi:glycosyltransferase involved in cell wall biosynthesis